jgi:hypothetical protein
VVPIAQLMVFPLGFTAPDCSRTLAQNVLPYRITRHKSIKLLLSANARSCYKERVQRAGFELLDESPAINVAKALTGTACPMSAKVDLCTVSIVMILMPAAAGTRHVPKLLPLA